jgi:hypothetical protein
MAYAGGARIPRRRVLVRWACQPQPAAGKVSVGAPAAREESAYSSAARSSGSCSAGRAIVR